MLTPFTGEPRIAAVGDAECVWKAPYKEHRPEGAEGNFGDHAKDAGKLAIATCDGQPNILKPLVANQVTPTTEKQLPRQKRDEVYGNHGQGIGDKDPRQRNQGMEVSAGSPTRDDPGQAEKVDLKRNQRCKRPD